VPLASTTRVGPYEIISTLGGGAMGEVYLARDSRLSRNVALKIIAPGSSDDAIRRRRFEAEARAASSLNHPNIITVHDFGSMDGISYIVSELVEGESFRNLIHRGPIPMRQLLELAVQMADGLTAAHEAGIVHRDLKPENVMVTRTGRVKILDFGLAKPMLSPVETTDSGHPTFDGSTTEPGLILGTVGYMSPEQARGESVGVASDQFSFGVILHEMAAGTPAFKRETPMQTLLAIVNVDRIPFTPGPVAFRLLVERCLAKDPAQRFGSTSELRDRLRKILDALPKPVEASEDESSGVEFDSSSGSLIAAKRPARPSHQVATVVLGALAVFSLGLVAARLAAHSPEPDIASYHFSPFAASSSIDAFPALSPSGRTVAYSEPVDGTFQIFTEQATLASKIQRTKSGQDCFYPFWSPDGMRIYYVSGQDLWSIGESGGAPESAVHNVVNADASPKDGTLALLRRNDTGLGESLWLMPRGGEPKRIGGLPPLQGQAKFSINGNEVGVSGSTLDGSTGFWIVNVPQSAVRQYPAGPMRGFSFFPDARHILFGTDHLWKSDAMSGDKSEITAGAGHENWPSIARDGHQAVFSTVDIHYDLVALPVGREGATMSVPPPALYSNSAPAWSPKRREFAYVTEQNGAPEIRLRDAQSGWERKVARPSDFPGATLSFSGLTFSPEGGRIAYTRTTAEGNSIWISSPAGEQPVRLIAGSHAVWSPDGNWLAFTTVENSQYVTRKLQLGGGQGAAVVKIGIGETLGWSPDNSWLLTMRSNGALVLVSPDGRKTQEAGRGNWLAATWTRDGSHMLALRRTAAAALQVVSLTRSGVEDGASPGGAVYPPALSFAAAIGYPPVSGFSLSPDGATVLLSMLRVRSDLWKATW
jgi:serine/threonine protein kinase